MAFVTVSKTDAARRQLEVAVLLYFNDRDPLAIHTLAAASQGVLENLVKRAGKTTLLHDSLFRQLPPDLANEIRKALRGPQNFLKHSDADPDATMEFSPELTEVILFDAVSSYARLTGAPSDPLKAFALWFAIHHPDWFSSVGPEVQRNLEMGRAIVAEGREKFLAEYLARQSGLNRP